MQRLLPLALASALTPAALADVDDFVDQVTPAFRGRSGAEFSGFDVLTVAFGAPNAPDLESCAAVTLTGLDPAGILTSTGNVYSFGTETSFRLDYAQDAAAPLEVSLQLRTLGSVPDAANVRLLPVDANGTAGAPLFADQVVPLGAAPGELQFVWGASLAGLQSASFQVLFEAASSSMSLDVVLLDVLTDRGSLEADAASVSAGAGGVQNLALDAGSDHAGNTYLVLGSRSGTAPGVPLDGVTVPLVLDGYTLNTIAGANGAVFQNTLGVLGGCGRAQASLAVPAGLDPALVGVTLNHAAVVIDTTQFVTVFATEAASLSIQP